MSYCKPYRTAQDSTYGAQNVWASNHKGVWHLDETSGTTHDSTSNANNGTPYNGVVQNANENE